MAYKQTSSLLVALATAALGLVAGVDGHSGVPLGSLGYFREPSLVVTRWGPFSTATNHGYESVDEISPMVPTSYQARNPPRLYAVQFIGDRPENLRHDQLTIRLASRGGFWPALPLTYTAHDLVGYQTKASLASLTAAVQALIGNQVAAKFSAAEFNIAEQGWTVGLDDHPPAVPQESAYDARTLATENAYRATLGESPVVYNADLQLASQAHADYLAQNGYNAPSFHDERRYDPGYTGANPWDRDMAFGWPSSLSGEVGIEWNRQMLAPVVIQNLVDTVYHRLDLLSDNLYSEGEGVSFGPTGAVVMDLGFGYADHLPPAVVYPYPGQVGVPICWTDLESPNPMPGGFGFVYGYPITVDLPTVATLDQLALSIWDGSRQLGAHVDRPGQDDMDANQAGLVPNLPLPMDSVLTVRFRARAVFQDGTIAPVRLVWRFATGGAGVSVTAVPQPAGRVLVAVASTGDASPMAHEPVEIDRGARVIARGQTQADGTVTLSVPGPGRYLAKIATGNAMAFWEGASS